MIDHRPQAPQRKKSKLRQKLRTPKQLAGGGKGGDTVVQVRNIIRESAAPDTSSPPVIPPATPPAVADYPRYTSGQTLTLYSRSLTVTDAGPVTHTLPPGVDGAYITIGQRGSNLLTLTASGTDKINGSPNDVAFNDSGAEITVRFYGAGGTWELTGTPLL